jgi:multimeric flavodoxin WrbA
VKHLLVIYHTQSGSTERLARSVHAGAVEEGGCAVELLRAMEASAVDLRRADGVAFCTPENFGYASGGMKDFLDRSYYPVAAEQLNRAYALVVSAGNDGSGAVRQMQRILRAYPMREVAEPLIVRGPPQPQDLQRAQELGAALAAGLALGIF